jgi:hypothetical protein
MRIVVGSAFRDTPPWRAERYFDRVAALREHARSGHSVRVIAAEGDSTDDTRAILAREAARCRLDVAFPECRTGAPRYGSTEEPARMRALSIVANAIMGAVEPEDDVLVYVENDIVWDPHTIGSLIDAARERRDGIDVWSPMVMAGAAFYDVWAFRGLDGARFAPFSPFHSGFGERLAVGLPLEVSSVGSCLVMRAEVARAVRIANGGALVDWCEQARLAGFRIAAWPAFSVQHV